MAQNVLKNNRLINFSTFQCSSQQQRNCHRQAYNSLMLKMSQLDRYEQAEDFTQCEKEQCKMVLTNQDKEYIDDWNWVQSNEELYSDVKDKIEKMKTNKWGYYIWNCRFCGTKNLIEKNNAHFAKNRSKVVIKQAVQGQRINRVSDNPLILFVIDNSTSMQQQLPKITQILQKQNKDQESHEKQLSNMINQKLKKTQIYKRIVENDKKQLNQIRKKIDVENKSQIYTDNITKYKILMSMTENVISSICNNGKYNTNSMKMSISNQLERKIGFMFFNSDIVLQKIPRITDTKVIKISNKEYMADQGTNDHLKVDFHNFKQLFQAGFNNSQDYGMDMTNFKFSDIFFNHSSPTGQSALGPALVVASGIISGYGSGSLIVVITDGKANKGIFSQGGLYSQQLAMLKFKLHKARAQTCLIKLQQKQSSDNAQNQQILQRYFRKNSSIISISLDEKQPLDELQRRLKSIIDKAITSKTWTNNIRIKCQNPNIRYNQKQMQRMKKKLFKQNQIQFISPQINQQKLTAFDYQHPFITQIIIEYQNIETKQQSKFMAYIVQKILKYGQFNKKEEEQFHSSQTLNNVISYLHSEGEKFDLQKIPLTLAKESFRSFVMDSFRHSVQQEFSRETMADMTDFIHKPIFKTPKEYIRSLVQKNQPYKHHEDQNNEEQYQTL